jgi:1-acyl-sn-glycerol-3-phosphate acyltransferase
VVSLERGDGLVIFPEGERRSGPRVESLHDGVVYLAARAGVPIVPVGIGGSEDAMPPGSRFIRPRRRIRVEVGEPLRFGNLRDGPLRRSEVRDGTAILQGRLQELFDAASSKRRRP